MSQFWNAERTKALLDLCQGGALKAKEVADRLGSGLTSSAVIGKADRLRKEGYAVRFAGKGSRAPRAAVAMPSICRHPAPFAAHPIPPDSRPLPGSVPVALVDLEPHHCRWPVVGGSCGADRVPGVPYCATHVNQSRCRNDRSCPPVRHNGS